MAVNKITQLTENTTPVSTDLFLIVDDPAGTLERVENERAVDRAAVLEVDRHFVGRPRTQQSVIDLLGDHLAFLACRRHVFGVAPWGGDRFAGGLRDEALRDEAIQVSDQETGPRFEVRPSFAQCAKLVEGNELT